MRRHVSGTDAFRAAAAAMDGPFVWGSTDCCRTACDAFLALFGFDPMAALRDAYSTRDEALRLVGDAGGFLPLVAKTCREAGLVPLDGPAWPGDLGAVRVTDTDGTVVPALALCIGPTWMVKSPHGRLLTSGAMGVWRAP